MLYNFFKDVFVDQSGKTLTLIRSNNDTLIVPFSFFTTSGDGTEPDFTNVMLRDHGHTVALGAYEASADAILYEYAPDYRKLCDKGNS
jgi:hypothetical protein